MHIWQAKVKALTNLGLSSPHAYKIASTFKSINHLALPSSCWDKALPVPSDRSFSSTGKYIRVKERRMDLVALKQNETKQNTPSCPPSVCRLWYRTLQILPLQSWGRTAAAWRDYVLRVRKLMKEREIFEDKSTCFFEVT